MKATTILLVIVSGVLVVAATVGVIRCLATGERREALFASEKITCAACAAKVQNALQTDAGAGAVTVDVSSRQIRVVFDPERTDPGALAIALGGAGFPARLLGVGSPGTTQTGAAATGGCACCNR